MRGRKVARPRPSPSKGDGVFRVLLPFPARILGGHPSATSMCHAVGVVHFQERETGPWMFLRRPRPLSCITIFTLRLKALVILLHFKEHGKPAFFS